MANPPGFSVVLSPPRAAGEVTVVDIEGTAVSLANVAGTLYAFDDTCSHRACPLSEGNLDEWTITCPCHRSRFDIRTGHILGGPATLPIRVRQVVTDGNRVLVER